MSRSTDFLSFGSIFLVGEPCTFFMSSEAVFKGAAFDSFSNEDLCVILQKFCLVLFVVFGGMFRMNIENELAWRLLDFSFAWTATTLNKGTQQGAPLQVVHDVTVRYIQSPWMSPFL